MNCLFAMLALIVLGAFGLGAGCAPKPVSSQATADPVGGRDSVIIPGIANMPTDLISEGDISVVGAAAFEMVSVAELSMLRATTREELEAAERATTSGAYLGDESRVVRVNGQEDRGVIGYAVGNGVGVGFETEFVFRFQDGGGDVGFEIAGEPAQPGRRMPSLLRVELSLKGNAGNALVVFLGDEGSFPSELARAVLPPFPPNEYAHRVGVRYVPGIVSVSLDGDTVLEAEALLGGGDASAAILAHPVESAYVLSWTFETLP